MTALNLIRRLHEHRRWANERALAACRPLGGDELHRTFPIGQGSVMLTLGHLYGAERTWLAALEGKAHPPSPFGVRFDSIATLEREWDALESRWQDFLLRLGEADLVRPVAKRSTSSGGGKVHVTPTYDVLLHVPLHANYTLAQLNNMLRQLGREPIDPMLITLSREQNAGRSAAG